MRHRPALFTAVLLLLFLGGIHVAQGDDKPASKPDLKPFVEEVRKLVEKHYPKAKVTLKDQTIHFEYNTRTFMIHEPLLRGEWQDAREELGPQKSGIYGDIELRAGEYGGMAIVPQSFDKRYFTLLLMAPYSKKLDHHLYIHLKYPRNVPEEFLKEFERLVDGFEEHVPARGRPGRNQDSSDLGKIQPPGGVPLLLSPGGPGTEISVDAIKKANKRLEAVPKEDLEKWVVELERIMDKKLKDGVPSARQVCRTDFVIHLSVAFDDLKWNAKTADNLFKRAQTMPASEAKVWKEAFEALLKKEIGQTDTTIYAGGPAWAVPLVLIPVDALHEGQKYSTERGKKYLARMKQLTADDVSLWKDKVDEFGGTQLDAAVNIILLDDYFDKEKFQRDKFKAAIGARKK